MESKIIQELLGKRVLILGFGKEGQSSLHFILRNNIHCTIGIADKQDITTFASGIAHDFPLQFHCGNDYLQAVSYYDFILKSPGIPSRLLSLRNNQTLSSQTDLFLMAFSHQTIGITGTKGKSTTTGLIHHLLLSAGKKSILTGNIGIPCFDIIPMIDSDSIVVFELSAHQLENILHSPHISVLLNIFEEHLDHFGSFEAYKNAKLKLISYSKPNDFIIINEDLSRLINQSIAKIRVFGNQNAIVMDENKFLRGTHNRMNITAALMAVEAAGVCKQVAQQHLYSFIGLPHRMEYVGNAGGIDFYNDSIATIPEATIAALQTLQKVDFLILGGFDRGINYQILADYLAQHPVTHILYTGDAGKRMANLIAEKNNTINFHPFATMAQAFELIKMNGSKTDICLLSPAAASYDQYKNFEQRGDIFKKFVLAYI